MAGSINMYKMKPLFKIDAVELPDVMYKMKPLISSAGFHDQGSSDAPNSVPQNLEQRQISLLNQLDTLINGISGNSTQQITTQKSAFASNLLTGSKPLDIVIHADPNNPPHLIGYILKILQANYKTLFRVHVHSCAPRNSDVFPQSMRHESRSPYQIIITLIWSSNGLLPRLCINPATSTSIHGESNITRFFGRFFGCYDSGNSLEEDLVMDMCCDYCDAITSTINGKKEKMAACKEVAKILPKIENNHLAKSLLLSALKNFNDLPQGDLKKWIESN